MASDNLLVTVWRASEDRGVSVSALKVKDSKKWIRSFVAMVAAVCGYLVIQFMGQAGEWFDLEAKIPNYVFVSQGLGIVAGLGIFLGIIGHKVASKHMQEVYEELVRVIWPENDSVLKSTVGITIGLAIIGGIFVAVDFSFSKLLELVY